MQLRPRQQIFVGKCCAALHEHRNTVGIAPTGAGKTVMLSAIAGHLKCTGAVIQHRDELVTQNLRMFMRVNPGAEVGIFDSSRKRWARDGWTFGMIQSVVRRLDSVPKLDCLIFDETHHITADSHLRLIHAARQQNPDLMVFGTTATPLRGDRKGLDAVFSNVADAITLQELIAGGFLVPPRAFVIDVGVREALKDVRKLLSDFDMEKVAEIMDKSQVNEKIVAEWQRVAGDRQTVVFCANIKHGQHVTEAFRAAGVSAVMVEGGMGDAERRTALAAFDRGDYQVVVNVAVLTEGWDCQPVSCVVLLRPSSFKSTMVQMIGRGLRIVDPERYPGIVKKDCLVLDFGTSLLTHGSLDVDGEIKAEGTHVCPQCAAEVPAGCRECPLCGYQWPKMNEAAERICTDCGCVNSANRRLCKGCGRVLIEDKEVEELRDFVLTEIDLFRDSPFAWEDLWNGLVLMASGFNAWSAVINYHGEWFAVGGSKESGTKMLAARQEKLIALTAGDDWMRGQESADDARKSKRWLNSPASAKQLELLAQTAMSAMGLTRYRASCLLAWKWSEKAIKSKVVASTQERARAA
jgi:DNA repair protein RadD